ncbi:MAG: aspartate ammonia-lyase, partial [Solimonas sp.]
ANAVIGYDKGAAIAKQAYKEGKSVLEVARALSGLDEQTLRKLLDPAGLTEGGIHSGPQSGS